MTFYGTRFESYVTPCSRAVLLLVSWIIIHRINKKYGRIAGWGMTMGMICLLTNQLLQRIRYVSDPTVIETDKKINEYLRDTNRL